MDEHERAERLIIERFSAVRITTGLLADVVRAEMDAASNPVRKRSPRKTWARGLSDARRASLDVTPTPTAKTPREVRPRRERPVNDWPRDLTLSSSTYDPDAAYWHSPNNPAH